jgi:hypothetical protein
MFQNGSSIGGVPAFQGGSPMRGSPRRCLTGDPRSSQELQGPGRVLLEVSQEISHRNFDISGQLRCECTDDNLGVQRDNQLPCVLEVYKKIDSPPPPTTLKEYLAKLRVGATRILRYILGRAHDEAQDVAYKE